MPPIKLIRVLSSKGVAFLATGHADTSVRYWRWEHHQLTLIWSSHQGTLVSYRADIKGAQLSEEDAALLKGWGAIGEPSVLRDEYGSKDEIKQHLAVTRTFIHVTSPEARSTQSVSTDSKGRSDAGLQTGCACKLM